MVDEVIEVECLVNNIWTSKGKTKFGEKVSLPATEAKQIVAAMKKILKETMRG